MTSWLAKGVRLPDEMSEVRERVSFVELRSTHWHALAGLWGELDELGAGAIDESVGHLFSRLSAMIGANGAHMIIGARILRDAVVCAADPLSGWRPLHMFHRQVPQEKHELVRVWQEH